MEMLMLVFGAGVVGGVVIGWAVKNYTLKNKLGKMAYKDMNTLVKTWRKEE